MTDKARGADLAALEQLLDAFGGDRTRWPAADRLRFAGLIAGDPAATALVAEAQAFDRLLDQAPRPSSQQEQAVANRVVALAGAEAPPQRRSSARSSGSAGLSSLRKPGFGASVPSWPAAALLAASLILGFVAGGAGFIPSMVGSDRAGDAAGSEWAMAPLDEGLQTVNDDELL